MLSTRNLFFFVLVIISVFLFQARVSCQELLLLDTLDYLPPTTEGARDYNLMIAASKGLDKEIERLISKGADINGKSYESATPLIFAVANNHLSTVLTLLSHNPDVNKITSNSETALLISVKNQNPQIAEALIRGGADIDLEDKNGAAPLHYAVLSGNLKMVDLLLYYEAECNKKAKDGTTPLMAAILSGYADITDLLFQNGANLEARDNMGYTPFLIAAQNGDTLVMNLLLKEGIDLYEKNNFNYNALALAIESNQKAAVELLLEKGDKWSEPENEEVSPYRVASTFGRKDILKILEEKNITGSQRLRIDEVSVTGSLKFNFRDYFTGLTISFKEPLLNAGFFTGCDLKPVYTRVLLKEAEGSYYQYFDKTSLAYAGLFKEFALSERSTLMKISITTSLSVGYSFGSEFRGTNLAPENKVKIIPAAGIKIEKNHFTFKSDLEYLNSGFYHIGPLWLRIGFAYNYFLGIVRSPGKTIKWD